MSQYSHPDRLLQTVCCQNERASLVSFGIPSNVNGLKAIGFCIIINKEPKRQLIELEIIFYFVILVLKYIMPLHTIPALIIYIIKYIHLSRKKFQCFLMVLNR
jgi:hypothetical protein